MKPRLLQVTSPNKLMFLLCFSREYPFATCERTNCRVKYSTAFRTFRDGDSTFRDTSSGSYPSLKVYVWSATNKHPNTCCLSNVHYRRLHYAFWCLVGELYNSRLEPASMWGSKAKHTPVHGWPRMTNKKRTLSPLYGSLQKAMGLSQTTEQRTVNSS